MATEADLINKFKDLNIPVGADFEELIHAAFAGANLADLVNNYDSRITTVENDLSTAKDSIQSNTDNKVTDNHDDTEQLNGVKVQPFNKLSDTIGGRNLLIGTATPASITGTNSVKQGANTYALVGGMSAYKLYQKYGSTFTLSYDFSVTDTANTYAGEMQQQFSNVPWGIGAVVNISSNNTSGHVIKTFSLANNSANIATGFQFRLDNVPTTSTITVSNMKLEKGSIATAWTPAPEDKVNVSDMRKPASDVAGIEEVNAKQDKIGYTPADDSKVAHLSGTNNFETVPTVNNNPLLLASSLPSDLARTSQQTNFTSGLKSGGVDVATAADLKSVADKAWYKLDNKYITSTYTVSPASTVLYKIDDTNKRLYLQGSIILTTGVSSDNKITLNLGSIVKKVLTVNGSYLGYAAGYGSWVTINNINMDTSTGLNFSPKSGLVQLSGDKLNPWESTGPFYITYDELV